MRAIAFPRRLLVAALFTVLTASLFAAATNSAPRERLLLDPGWKFHLGNEWGFAQSLTKAGTGSGPASKSFSDASWRTVNLPHDWVVELPFDSSSDGSHGFHPVGPGFAANNVAWYRRTFDLPESDAGKRIGLEFAPGAEEGLTAAAGSPAITKAATAVSATTSPTWPMSAAKTSSP